MYTLVMDLGRCWEEAKVPNTYRAKLTGKGQVQVPKAVRDALGAGRGDEVVFRVDEQGAVYVTCERRVNLMDLAGALKPEMGRVDREAEREAVRRHAAQRERERLKRAARETSGEGESGRE